MNDVDVRRLVVFAVTYLFVAFPQLGTRIGIRLTRPAAALVGAVAMVSIGGLPLAQAYAAVDLDVLAFLLGVLLLVGYLEVAGAFEWLAGAAVARARSPRLLLGAAVLVSGIASAFVMNDTMCVILTPLVLIAVQRLGYRPLPFLLAIALAANVGSAMAITGNPQNMIIGLASRIGFGPFLVALAPSSLGGLVIVYAVLSIAFRRDLAPEVAPTDGVPAWAAAEGSPEVPVARELHRGLALLAGGVFVACIIGWLIGLSLPLVALGGAAVLIVAARRDPTEVIAGVDWSLLLFFAALFIVTRGVEQTPLVVAGTRLALDNLHGPGLRDASVVSGAMLVLSNLVSNVPAVLLWRPAVGALPHADFVWIVLAMSSTFAGNLTLLGSMANLIVAERAGKAGSHLGFFDYLKVGVPVTVLTTLWGIIALSLFAVR